MKQVFEILVPLALIIVLLMCMMNNNSEEYFSVGGKYHSDKKEHDDGFKVGGPGCTKEHRDGFKVGANLPGNSGNTCHVTMVWADWCGFSNKAKPQFESLKGEYEGKELDGCKLTFKQIEEKGDDEFSEWDEASMGRDYLHDVYASQCLCSHQPASCRC